MRTNKTWRKLNRCDDGNPPYHLAWTVLNPEMKMCKSGKMFCTLTLAEAPWFIYGIFGMQMNPTHNLHFKMAKS